MQILNKQGGGFDEDDIEVLEIVAAIAATAIENSELQREAQMAAVARAVGNVSHDIKNKVAPVAMVADLLGPDLKTMFSDLDAVAEGMDPELREAVSDATVQVRGEYAEHCEILRDQVRAVQEHTKLISDALKGIETTPQLEPCDLSAIVRDQVRELVPVARERGVTITTDLADVPSVACDRYLIRSAMFNLLNNAIPETPPGGRISVRMTFTEAGAFPQGDCVCVEVADTGNGMPPHVLQRLLRGEANSTKPGGTGLGTKIVFNAARAHGGLLEGESAEGVGTTIRVKLPLSSGP
jgi:signal transduction histidine kinase